MIRVDEVSPYTDHYFINSRIACEKANNRVRVVYDAGANLREISTRSGDGLFVRLNFTDS